MKIPHIIPILIICFATGCATWFDQEVVERQVVAEMSDGTFKTNSILVTNIVVKPGIRSGISTAKSVTPYVPGPAGGVLSILLGLSSVGLGWFARFQTNKKRAAEQKQTQLSAALTTADQIQTALVKGIENGSTDGTVKKAVRKQADIAGIAGEVAGLVATVLKR